MAPLLGKWVPHTGACADPDGSEYLPLLISKAKASAGEGTCNFLSTKQEGSRWRVVAECSDGQSAWTANVDLGISEGRLTWASERGTQSYVRCQPTVVAKAPTRSRVAAHRSPKKVARAGARKGSGVRVTAGPGGAAQPGWAMLRVR